MTEKRFLSKRKVIHKSSTYKVTNTNESDYKLKAYNQINPVREDISTFLG